MVYFSNLHPSLPHIYELRNHYEVELFFIFQYPWKIESIRKVKRDVENGGFKFNSITEHPLKVPSMTHLRNLGITYSSNSDYFFFADDNLVFTAGTKQYPQSSGRRYLQAIDYLKNYPNCGFVMCEGSLGGSVQKLEISSTKVGLFATTRGLILRNIGAKKIFRSTDNLIGGLEESIACYHIIEEGFYPAKQFNNPTLHRHTSKPGKKGCIGIHDQAIWSRNCEKYIRERYEDPDWTHQSRKWPKGLKKKFVLNGGNQEVLVKRIYKQQY